MSMLLRGKRKVNYFGEKKQKNPRIFYDCSGINSLPDSVLLDIFSRLQFKEICICSSVCRRWRKVANDFTLKKIIIMEKPLQRKYLKDFISNHFTEHLNELRWGGSSFDACFGRMFFSEISKRCKNMKRFDLCVNRLPVKILSCNVIPPSISHLGIQTMEKSSVDRAQNLMWSRSFFCSKRPSLTMSHLTCLVLNNSGIVFPFKDIWQNFKSLKALYVEGCENFDDYQLKKMMEILPKLEILDIEKTSVSSRGVEFILETCVNIRELFIGHFYIANHVLKVRYRQNMPHLTHLCVRHTKITSQGLHYFLSECPDNSAVKVDSDRKCETCNDQFMMPKPSYFSHHCNHHFSHECPNNEMI